MSEFDNLATMFFAQAVRYAAQPRYRFKRDSHWREVTWSACAERVRSLARGLLALGLDPGDRVALLSATRPEWVELDLAILAAGGNTVPIYPSNLAAECGYIVVNSESAIVCVENEAQLAKLRQVERDGFELDGTAYPVAPRVVISVDRTSDPTVLTLDDLVERGRTVPAEEIDRRIGRVGRGDLATLVYTSGTTGPPKGVMQTHGNHLAAVESAGRIGLMAEGDVDFFFLPLAHSFARFIEYAGIFSGSVTAFAQSIDTLLDDARESRPQLFPAVPRIYEKVFARVQATRQGAAGLRRVLLDWAFSVGHRLSERQLTGAPTSALLSMQGSLADALVFSKIRAVLGGQIKFLVSGGAPLAPEIARFLHDLGLVVLEGYGLTETTPILTVNRPSRYKLGTVGLPLDIVTLRIADDGEILARGPNVALGYYRRPEATREAWDADGWFHTGDIGEIDADGFLRITDRKKDLIKTSGGKYVAPQTVENLLKTQPYISQAVLVGDRRKYCTALITLDADEVQTWATREGVHLPPRREEWASVPAIHKLIDEEVAAANRRLASYESVKYFRIVPRDFSVDGGELTPSLKVKRKVVFDRYQGLIDEMY